MSANTTSAISYIFTFKLCSGYNIVQLPNSITIPNLKKIFIRKLSYNFNTSFQYIGLLSLQGWDLHSYSDGIATSSYTISLLNPSGVQNSVISYINNTSKADIDLVYGSVQSQFIITFNTDNSNGSGSLGQMSVGGSAYVTPSNPIVIEIEFQ